ncbi:hypothetical protein I6A60_35935 [Frankia sp. AgB1.9]|uniref:hypothetical protein n=1 Tax=unclassified Frankia TaxID=2632575 RepID=UPI0019314D65|nr:MULTISPECIES: hypothetical protein [unclassified Frankia]MBL7487790.1 hypothetical protein [Frankia sp. AgW1.1]MBL7553205.1 hypothetical protein [Frankia sp. AgB1.9]MBL7622950.1 hypothetical protein [Frankia sp. AgB1.8]
MGSVLDTVTALVDRRLIRSTLVQLLAFLAANGALIITRLGWKSTALWWYARSGTEKGALVVATVAVLISAATALAGQINGLLRLYEGYALPWPLRLAAERRRTHHVRRFHRLPLDSPLRHTRYPPLIDWFMPSAVGNLLRASETHAFQCYRIDSAVVWPRLYAVLPADFKSEFAAARERLDAAVASFTLTLLFVASSTAITTLTQPWFVPLATFAFTATVSWVAHRGVFRAAVPYAELVRTAFDLHRGLVIDAIGWQHPTSYGAERAQWAQICRLWQQGIPDGPIGARALLYPRSTSEPLI